MAGGRDFAPPARPQTRGGDGAAPAAAAAQWPRRGGGVRPRRLQTVAATAVLYGTGGRELGVRPVLGASGDDLGRLSDAEAVQLFADLLWADSGARGIPASIDVPRSIYARDGGIDATVRAPEVVPGQGVIGPGVTRYQIKSGKGFDPAARDSRRRLLFRPGGGGELRPRIKECLDKGELLVVVLFGTDAPDVERDSEDLVRKELAGVDPRYGGARVEVWRQNRLLGHMARHPPLQRRLRGASAVPFLAHPQWASTSEDMTRQFVPGPSQGDLIDGARRALRGAPGRNDVRIAGRPGSGKTRIAHEITRPRDLAARTLYFENPSHVQHDNFLNLLLEDASAGAILVVDECDTEGWRYLQDRTAKTGGRVRLVTIYNKVDSGECLRLDDLGLAEIKRIIEGYGAKVPGDAVDSLALACRPSPRYAHRFAKIMASDPAGFLNTAIREDEIHERYIRAGLAPQDGEQARKRKSVLLQFGIFARVGRKQPHADEYEFLRKMCSQEYGIAPGEFDATVDDLRRLKILQGYKELYIAPHMLHFWLWGEWWRIHGGGPAPGMFVSPGGGGMPDGLKRAFREMASADSGPDSGSAAAARIMLGRGGPFDDGGGDALEDPDGARTFGALARADPGSAMRLLERTVCRWDDRRLAAFDGGRRSVVGAIEEMAAGSGDLLEAAVGALLPLAANETERGIANNATGVLARLFVMAPDMLAGTPAGIEDRLALLEGMLGRGDGRRRALALAACDSALESIHASRLDCEQIPALWNPKNWIPAEAEADAYRRVLFMLRGMLGGADRAEGRAAAAIILKRATELSRFRTVSGAAVDALRDALEKGAADRCEVARAAEIMLRTDEARMDGEAAGACRRLASELAGGSYRSRMRRYVGAEIPSGAARLPDRAGAGRIESAVRDLAAESLRDRGALLGMADWLFGPGVGNAQMFGRELAAQDAGHSLLPDLLEAMSESGAELSEALISGYMGEVSLRDAALWESTVGAMERSGRLAPLVPAVTWWSRITDESWGRLVRMHGRGAATRDDLAMFAYGGRACGLSDGAFAEAVATMLSGPPPPPEPADGARAALAFLAGRCECAGPARAIPAEAAWRAVLDDAFLTGPPNGNRAGLEYGHWAAVALRLARDDPGRIPRLARAVFRAMGSDGGMFSGPYREAFGVLGAMAEAAPDRVWECAAEHLEAPPGRRARRILEWAGGRIPGPAPEPGGAFLDRVPPESVWAWVDKDPDARAPCIAEFAPRSILGRGSIARGLLARYGARREVRDELHRNFMGAWWSGSGADHYAREKRECEEAAAAESDPNVGRWLAERIELIDEAIGRERAVEARMQ